jgi:hypothetical protein
MNTTIRKLITLGLTLIPLFVANSAMAEIGESFYTPEVEQGKVEIEFVAETLKKPNEIRESAVAIELGYGVKDYWFTQISAE